MYNIVFVCYGNICRSPMAEMIFKDMIYKNNKRYLLSCVSRGTSMEELGNDIYPDAKNFLLENNIGIEKHRAKQFSKDEYEKYDYIIIMEERNKKDLLRIVGEDKDNKIKLLLDFTNTPGDIEDPWYTGNFSKVYSQIYDGCIGLYNYLTSLEGENDR